LSFSACWTAFTCSAFPPAAAEPPDLPLFIAEPDFMSLLEPEDIEPDVLPAPDDFVSVEDEPAPELVAGEELDEPLLPVCGLADGDDGFF